MWLYRGQPPVSHFSLPPCPHARSGSISLWNPKKAYERGSSKWKQKEPRFQESKAGSPAFPLGWLRSLSDITSPLSSISLRLEMKLGQPVWQFYGLWVCQSFSHVRLFATPCTTKPVRLLCPWNFLGKNTGVDCHSLLQGIFPTQGSNSVSCMAGRVFTIWATREYAAKS